MRRFATVLVLALLAVPALAQRDPFAPGGRTPAPQQQAPQAGPQGGPSPQGWRREVADTGTVYFYCASNACRDGDVVSYRLQPAGQRWSFERFRDQQARANESMLRDGRLRNVEMSGPRDESEDGAVVYVADKSLTDASGRVTGMVSAYIAVGRGHLTLVATAGSLSGAGDNIVPFRRALIAWLRGGAR